MNSFIFSARSTELNTIIVCGFENGLEKLFHSTLYIIYIYIYIQSTLFMYMNIIYIHSTL